MALGVLYADYAFHPTVRALVTGIGVTGAGLLVGTAVKLGRDLVRKPAALALVAACFFTVGVGRVSMYFVLPIALAVSLFASRKGWL